MSAGASQYSVSDLIARVITHSGLNREQFVQALGYGKATKGLRRVGRWLEHGRGDHGCFRRIVNTFHPDPGELEKALTDTEAIHQREQFGAIREIEELERRRFRSFVWVHTEDGAHSFLTAIGEKQVKTLLMPEGFEYLSESERLDVVRRMVREHYEATGGRYVGFGKILRYRYSRTFDQSTVLDIGGNVIEENGGQFLLPEVWLELH